MERAVERDGALGLVNDAIRRLAASDSGSETWEFFCECPDTECRRLVTLTVDEFDELRRASPSARVVSAGHDE